jgi:hypothetical protein
MGQNARIADGRIEIDTDAWLAQRTGKSLPLVTEQFTNFSMSLSEACMPTDHAIPPLVRVALFITTKTDRVLFHAQRAQLQVESRGLLSLSLGIFIHRYPDADHDSVVFATPIEGSYIVGPSTAYSDTAGWDDDWASLEARITCPQDHTYFYNGKDLTVDGVQRKITDVFPTSRILTPDNNAKSATYQQTLITCPQCGRTCDVELADI